MAHQPPICEFVPRYRCPRCPGMPLLKVYVTVRRSERRRASPVWYLRCKKCSYRAKAVVRVIPPFPPVTTP